jgi:hypothetical protein
MPFGNRPWSHRCLLPEYPRPMLDLSKEKRPGMKLSELGMCIFCTLLFSCSSPVSLTVHSLFNGAGQNLPKSLKTLLTWHWFQAANWLKTDAGWTLRSIFTSFSENSWKEGKAVSHYRGGFKAVKKKKAGEGNRTLMTSLEGWSSTIELRPHIMHYPSRFGAGGQELEWKKFRE